MRTAVRNVAKHFPTAIISGRCRDKVLSPYGVSCVVDVPCISSNIYCLILLLLNVFVHPFQVSEFVGLRELHYAGSHGMDIMGPVRESGTNTDHPNSIRSTDKPVSNINFILISLICITNYANLTIFCVTCE